MLKYTIPYIYFYIILLSSSNSLAESCPIKSDEVIVNIDVSKTLRADIPLQLFGFNVPWSDFQKAYFDNGAVKADVIEWLKPFTGAVYRYPGGNLSNWFDWRSSVGPIASRPMIYADFGRKFRVDFGLTEFAQFVKDVDGKAIYTINLTNGSNNINSIGQATIDALDLLSFVKNSSVFKCVGGDGCPLIGWELGNELDWAPNNLSASDYAAKSSIVVKSATSEYPEINWIASGKTAPWDSKSKSFQSFNENILNDAPKNVESLSIHPYYDGINIPAAVQYINNYASTLKNVGRTGSVFITEHARWPSMPLSGKWRDNWDQATNLGGAISTSDFILALIDVESVRAANWHALGLSGPWKLFDVNTKNGTLYPTPVYWGMRVLREAILLDSVSVKYNDSYKSIYSGNYSIRLVATTTKDRSKISVLGVNRSPFHRKISFARSDTSAKTISEGYILEISGESLDSQNTTEQPGKILMKKRAIPKSNEYACISPLSVFAIVSK